MVKNNKYLSIDKKIEHKKLKANKLSGFGLSWSKSTNNSQEQVGRKRFRCWEYLWNNTRDSAGTSPEQEVEEEAYCCSGGNYDD